MSNTESGKGAIAERDDARGAVALLIEAAADAAKLLESVAPHHPQTAKLNAAVSKVQAGGK